MEVPLGCLAVAYLLEEEGGGNCQNGPTTVKLGLVCAQVPEESGKEPAHSEDGAESLAVWLILPHLLQELSSPQITVFLKQS